MHQDQSTAEGLSIRRQGAIGLVEIDRPSKRNALTMDMRRRLAEAWPGFARDPLIYAVVVRSVADGQFSSGGDIWEMVELAQRDLAAARLGLADELSLMWLAECFSKPTISLIDGPVMGGGNTISLRGTHRVAGPRYAFAMPEARLGFIPNNGLAYNFARMPGEIGMYLALCGATIGRADAYRLGLVTHCIGADQFGAICAGLAEADPVDPILDERHADPGPGELPRYAGVIGRCFGAGTVEEIVERLLHQTGPDAEWAQVTAHELEQRSPLALKLTHRLVREASALDLREVLALEYRLTSRLLELPDLHEAIRTVLVEKDRKPRWQPARLADVGSSTIAALFTPLDELPLVLPTREQMQVMRV